jgi:hypothetical protein
MSPPITWTSLCWDGNVASIRHQALLRSQHDIGRNWELVQLPGAFLADVRSGWRTTRGGELSFVVQDLTNRKCLETLFGGPFVAIPSKRTWSSGNGGFN